MDVPVKELARGVIKIWHNRLREITLVEAVILLKHLGGFHHDKITVLYKGYVRLEIIDLLNYFGYYEKCINLRPVYFEGGPYNNRHYKGTFHTVVTDRVLLAAEEHGTEFVIKAIDYAKSYGPANG